ncbi:MAG: hypothetical protein ACXVH7_13265, partial [Thermoanaerobaculia bacterium]
QADAGLRVPAGASSGDLSLQLSLEDEKAADIFFPQPSVEIGATHVESVTRLTAQLTITHPMGVRVGDSIEFLGYDLRAPQPLHAGDNLTLTLFWRAAKSTSTFYTVFTHLLDAHSQIFGQNDSPPASGERATTGWAPGELIADGHSFRVDSGAAPGKYTLEIGMYDPASGTRLPVLDSASRPAGDRILLQELTVQ